jgi:hypothetical protein
LAGNNPGTAAESFIAGSVSYLKQQIDAIYQAASTAGQPEPPGAYQLPAAINYSPYQPCQ